MTVTETIQASLLMPSQEGDFRVIVESPIHEELQIVDRSNYGMIRCERGMCVLVGYIARDGSWPCWIGTGTKSELTKGLRERFGSDPTWSQAVVRPCQTDEETASMGAGMARLLLSEGTNVVLTEPVTPEPPGGRVEPAPALVVVERTLHMLVGYRKEEAKTDRAF